MLQVSSDPFDISKWLCTWPALPLLRISRESCSQTWTQLPLLCWSLSHYATLYHWTIEHQPAIFTLDIRKKNYIFPPEVPLHASWWKNSKEYKTPYSCITSLSKISAHENVWRCLSVSFSSSTFPYTYLLSQVGCVYLPWCGCVFVHSTPVESSHCCPFCRRICPVCWHSLKLWFLIYFLLY